jgi:hypothetical protein
VGNIFQVLSGTSEGESNTLKNQWHAAGYKINLTHIWGMVYLNWTELHRKKIESFCDYDN